ncbi:uncharacterized protein N0V89_008048 [Didymosphaeria variabile]|uniref:BTB domain-containing protein n=1 Tax=Didymosphaeria variabile TaxID=1932322 RepID=A0A9W9C8H5_9PLEO|nr:uncharacterized protein N0V89_008048 [Didymosphaeria variabile]KAJ4349433.1 hypothetical protein N0V89_008048 [Didymosphaeria variabile]
MPPCISSSQDSNIDDGLKLEGAEAQSHQQTVSSGAGHSAVNESPKQCISLDVISRTVIAVECGKGLSAQYMIPLSLLCAQSQKQLDVFQQAEDLHDSYVKVKAIKKQAKSVFSLLEIHNIVHTDKSREKAMAIILECLHRFPIAKYQVGIAQRITEATDVVFQKNEIFIVSPGKKFDRSKVPKNDVHGRLKILKDEAVYTVLERIHFCLCKLKTLEEKKAPANAVQAAAQRRLILPNEHPSTVEALVNWLYKDGLSFTDINNLCEIHALADKLGIEGLAAECTGLLSTATSRILLRAKSEGITLRGLLSECARNQARGQDTDKENSTLSSFSVIGEIFKITLQKPAPPAVLQDLVAEAIAVSEDDQLFHELLPVINLDMRGKVAMAMIRNAKAKAAAVANREHSHSQVSSGASRNASVKSEVSYDKDQE